MDAAGRLLPAPTGRRSRVRRTLATAPRTLWHRHLVPRVRRLAAPGHRHLTVPLAALTVVSTAATALSPVLGRWPLALALLSPRVPFLVLAAHSAPAPVFLVLATLRSCVADPFTYLLGRRLGADGPPRGVVGRVLARFGTHGAFAAVLLRPIGRHLFAAGAVRARPVLVATADVLGTVAFLWLLQAGVSVL